MVIVYSYLLSFLLFVATFLYAKSISKHDLLDMLWGVAFIVPSLFSLIVSWRFSIPTIIMTLLVCLWGLRLSYHIMKRNKNMVEDFRYQKYREEYKGKHFDLYFFFKMYVLQFVLSVLISFQVVYTNTKGLEDFTYLTALGIVIWVIGYYFESVGDRQLKEFKAKPENKGKLMTTGLWKYTRHPNYFGEATMWWGIYIVAISNFEHYFLVFSPLVISILVRYVSGVPLLEKKYDAKPREGWAEYKERTSIFFPLPPR